MTDYTPFKGRLDTRPPRLELLERVWQMRTPSGRVLTCDIYRTVAPGVEVRAGYSPDDFLRSQLALEIGSAREIAESWKQEVVAKGFEEIPVRTQWLTRTPVRRNASRNRADAGRPDGRAGGI